MKINSGLIIFVIVFGSVIVGSFALGNLDPITPTMAHSQAQLTIGSGLTAGISTALNWIFKLALGGICTGFGVAAFNEARKGYKLWKRQSQAGRWQGGPNAGYQRQAQSPRATMTDKLLLMLAGRLPGQDMGRYKTSPYSIPERDDDDDLYIQM